MICQGCLKTSKENICSKCKDELFDGQSISLDLAFDSPARDTSELFSYQANRKSISGVQLKYSLKIVDNTLQVTEESGHYILKPIPIGAFQYLSQAPANEHLTMQIAKQAFRIPTPPCALVRFRDGTPAYLTRRFDKTESMKYHQEDFAQIANISSETHGEFYKYDLSYEELAKLIEQNVSTYHTEIEKFFQLILFNYVFSNGDAHAKNFSLIQSKRGTYVLSPAYDLLCTRIHTPNESDMALTLFKDKYTEVYEAYGFYTYQDFSQFGQHIGINALKVQKIIDKFIKHQELIYSLIKNSFLKDDLKITYKEYYEDRLSRLNMKPIQPKD